MSKKEMLLRIVPQEHSKHSIVPTSGTKVLTPDGAEIRGITRIVLIADPDDVWRAEISCLISPPEITVLADLDRRYAQTRWQRFWTWLRFGAVRA